MKIRTYFAILAGSVVLIPFVLLTMGMLFWSLTRSTDSLPSYEQLPRRAGILTDEATWDQVREILARRPPNSDNFVFDQNFRLIWGTTRLGPVEKSGDTLTLQESIRILQGGEVPRDIFLFQPARTQVWIIQVQANASPSAVNIQKALVTLAIGLLVVLVISVTLAVIMGRVLANSVVRLEKAARRIAGGDLNSPVVLRGGGTEEIRSLGQALETMRQSLLEEEARQSRFVMGVSHDLKTPLALIKGYVELLKDGPTGSADAQEARFDLILDKADQLDGMIDHLIDYSKVNTGDWQQTWSPLVLKPFLEEFIQALVPDSQLLDRQLVSQLDIPGDWAVPCDRRSIRRCLENLVHNALRYTQPGGTVGLAARQVPTGVEIVVWDNGPGIAADDLPHLFDPFYRGTHSRREPGMGLGLSIVKTILDSHGWTIRAESHQGARFILHIPSQDKPL